MKAKIVVVGNEKGGTGKSTLAMHLVVQWLREGKKVAVVDLDNRQGTVSRYLENRKKFMEKEDINLPMPEYMRLINISNEIMFLRAQLERLSKEYDIIVLDTPGMDSALTMEAVFMADTLVTPINDSLLDLDVLGKIDSTSLQVKAPGQYTERITFVRKKRQMMGKKPLNWIVMRNRLSPFKNKNRLLVEKLLEKLSVCVHFTVLPGLTERIIFRELFLKGLTMLDLRENGIKVPLSLSHVAARQEIRQLATQIL